MTCLYDSNDFREEFLPLRHPSLERPKIESISFDN